MLNITLRPHQVDAMDGLNKSLETNRTTLIYAPTGAGKTAIAAYKIDDYIKQGLRVLFTVPYTTLVMQTWGKFREYGLPDAGIIWQKHHLTNYSKQIQIASLDTLIRRDPEIFDLFDIIFIDECHIKRVLMLQVIKETESKVIGMTATPFCSWLGQYYEDMVKVSSTTELIGKGMLSDYIIVGDNNPSREGIKTTYSTTYGADYDQTQAAEVMRELVSDAPKEWLRHGNNEPTIAFCMNVLHANDMANQFSKHDINCEVITAKTPMESRPAMFKRFREGTTKILVSVGCLIAGFDEDVRCIIDAQMTKSIIRYVQFTGRGLRIADGKKHCIIISMSGNWSVLGMPDTISIDSLKDNSDGLKTAKSVMEELEKTDKKPKKCPACPRIKRPDEYECAECGFKPRYGEDAEGDKSVDLELITRQKQIEDNEHQQKFYSELVGYYDQQLSAGRKWKHGWPAMKYKEKFKEWPSRSLIRTPIDPSKNTMNWIRSTFIKWNKSKERRA